MWAGSSDSYAAKRTAHQTTLRSRKLWRFRVLRNKEVRPLYALPGQRATKGQEEQGNEEGNGRHYTPPTIPPLDAWQAQTATRSGWGILDHAVGSPYFTCT